MEKNEEKSAKVKLVLDTILAAFIAILVIALLVVCFGFILWLGGTTVHPSVHNLFVLLTIADLPFKEYCLLSLYLVIFAFFIKVIFTSYKKDKDK